MLTAIFEVSSPLDSLSSNFQSVNNKTELWPQHSRVLIQAELDTPTTNILIEEAQEQPPFCSRRQGFSARFCRQFFFCRLLWHPRFSLAVTHCAVLRELMKFWCALKKTVLHFFWLNWLWLCSADRPVSKVSGFATHQCWHLKVNKTIWTLRCPSLIGNTGWIYCLM